jgi:outer membrane protein OmpA-like peptidoglycan-associated protein
MPAEKNILYVAKAVKPGYIDDCLNFRIESSDTTSLYEVPRPLMLDKLEVNKSFRVENIYYDLDKWFIREDARPALDNLVEIMKKYPITAELSSHTDSRASQAYNDELSQKRAEAAVRYIVLQGVDPSRIIAKGYGESRLVNGCSDGVICTEEEHQANRRTEFKILSIEQQVSQNDFNPDTFVTDDEVDVYLFDPEFFRKCFGSIALPRENITNDLKVEKTVAQEVLLPAPAQTVSGACYGVQLAAVGNIMPVNDPWFKGIKDIKIYKSGRLNKYVAGCNDRETAQKLLADIQAKGFKEAFLVKIENEQILLAR